MTAQNPTIQIAKEQSQFEACFSVIQTLREHLTKSRFLDQLERQQQAGYKLVYLEDKMEIKSVAGFRISENLAWEKFMYIDDFVTSDSEQSKGYGQRLMQWLINYAKNNHCQTMHLDSGVQRFDAHRFYIKQGFDIKSHHFSISL